MNVCTNFQGKHFKELTSYFSEQWTNWLSNRLKLPSIEQRCFISISWDTGDIKLESHYFDYVHLDVHVYILTYTKYAPLSLLSQRQMIDLLPNACISMTANASVL